MNYARIINNIAVDVCHDPAECFHPTLAVEFVEVPDEVSHGWALDNGIWSAPPPPPEPVPEPKNLTRLEFELHVQTASGLTDPQFFAIIQDPEMALFWYRLDKVTSIGREDQLTQNGLTSMVTAGHLTDAQVVIINDTWPTE